MYMPTSVALLAGDLGWSAHVPRGARELAIKVQRDQERLTTITGRSPTVQELAQYMELSIEDVLAGIEAAGARHAASLDAPLENGDDDDGTLADTLGVEEPGFELVENRRRRRRRDVSAVRPRATNPDASVLRTSNPKRDREGDRGLTDAHLAAPAPRYRRVTELSESEPTEAVDEPPTDSRRALARSRSVGRSGGPSPQVGFY